MRKITSRIPLGSVAAIQPNLQPGTNHLFDKDPRVRTGTVCPKAPIGTNGFFPKFIFCAFGIPPIWAILKYTANSKAISTPSRPPLSVGRHRRPPPPATTSGHHLRHRRPPPPASTAGHHRRPPPPTTTAGHHLRPSPPPPPATTASHHLRPPPPATAGHHLRHRRPSPPPPPATTSGYRLRPPPATADHHLLHRRPLPSFYIAITVLQTKQKKAERQASDGGPVERWALGGGLLERRSSSGGLAEHRALGGGPLERRALGGGPAERRPSGGGPADRRASGGGPTVVRQNTGGGRGGARRQERSPISLLVPWAWVPLFKRNEGSIYRFPRVTRLNSVFLGSLDSSCRAARFDYKLVMFGDRLCLNEVRIK
ncbi:hypothetical protein M5K25_026177 [Dendrobium thyrsiflorum]|uniref:Uncharacterized protein n=1 Tax=Dendrobium thyrsiflorum TaxID=117978 RepID=A0ABD0TX29_DENTH